MRLSNLLPPLRNHVNRMRLSIIPLLFLLLPLAEIATFIVVGHEIGVGWTLLLILASGLTGAVLLRIQGLGVLRKLQSASQTGENPGRQIVHGAMIVIAALLLILPGFLSDIVGILLFIPAVRDLGWRLIRERIRVVTRRNTSGFSAQASAGFGHPEPGPIRSRESGEIRVIELDDDDFSRDDRTGRGRDPRDPG